MSSTLELAILHADACGFSGAMAMSEDQAVGKLRAGHRLIEQTARMFCGRVIDTAGDSALLTFESSRAAFQAARHIGEAADPEFKSNEEIRPFEFRIGLTKGRVKVSENRIFGHCVNMAARINSLVGRGNVGIDRSIWGEVQSLTQGKHVKPRVLFAKPDEPFVDFFEVSGPSAISEDNAPGSRPRNEPIIVIFPNFSGADHRHQREHNSAIEAFLWECAALSGAQGWQTSISAELPANPHVAGSATDYVIQVRVTDMSKGFRLSVSLTSSHMGYRTRHFTRDSGTTDEHAANALALASLVGSAIASVENERAATSRSAGSHQLVAAGRASLSGFSSEHFAKGLGYMRAALKVDPEYPLLLSSLGRAHALAWRFGWSDPAIDHLETARNFADQAVRLAPNDPRCQADLGFVRFWSNEPLESAWHYERSLDALPFHPELAADAGMVFSYVERNAEAASVLERSIANLPSDADYRLWSLGDVYFAKRDYANSLKWLSRMSDQSQAQRLLAANKARLGLDPSRHVAKVLEMQPDFSVRHWVAIQPFTNERDRIDYEEALLMAGLPP